MGRGSKGKLKKKVGRTEKNRGRKALWRGESHNRQLFSMLNPCKGFQGLARGKSSVEQEEKVGGRREDRQV